MRYFDGKLNENNFIEVMECLKVLFKEFVEKTIDRNLMADIYGIFYQTNLWLGKGGALEDIEVQYKNKIEEWLKIFSYAVALLLEYSEEFEEEEFYKEVFYEYNNYLEGISNYK